MCRLSLIAILIVGFPLSTQADETFVTIHKVIGTRMSVSKEDGGGRGRRGGASTSATSKESAGPSTVQGRGRFTRSGTTSTAQQVILTVPSTTKITSATRERRTFEFRAGAELAGGLKNRIFQNIQKPLSARIVTQGNRITEINVITEDTDINQSNTDQAGQTVIAIRPKRPPMKRT